MLACLRRSCSVWTESILALAMSSNSHSWNSCLTPPPVSRKDKKGRGMHHEIQELSSAASQHTESKQGSARKEGGSAVTESKQGSARKEGGSAVTLSSGTDEFVDEACHTPRDPADRATIDVVTAVSSQDEDQAVPQTPDGDDSVQFLGSGYTTTATWPVPSPSSDGARTKERIRLCNRRLYALSSIGSSVPSVPSPMPPSPCTPPRRRPDALTWDVVAAWSARHGGTPTASERMTMFGQPSWDHRPAKRARHS